MDGQPILIAPIKEEEEEEQGKQQYKYMILS